MTYKLNSTLSDKSFFASLLGNTEESLPDSPTIVKITHSFHSNVPFHGTFLAGTILLATAAFLYSSVIGFHFHLISYNFSVTLIVGGAILTLSSIVHGIAFGFFKTYYPNHLMAEHAFKPFKDDLLTLEYHQDVPILTIDYRGGNYRDIGFAQGYCLGPYICQIQREMETIQSESFGHEWRRLHGEVKNIIKALKQEPKCKNYLTELDGIVDGYNKWARHQGQPRLDIKSLLLLHLVADCTHLNPAIIGSEKILPQLKTIGCTGAIGKNSKGDIVIARTMDWIPYGILGTLSCSVRRVYDDYVTEEDGFPGFVGTLTGMRKGNNGDHLSLFMNVCLPYNMQKTEAFDRLPAVFFNRMCLESLSSASNLSEYIQERQLLGSYHLTVADGVQAVSVEIQPKARHFIRELEEGQLLVITNCSYDSFGTYQHQFWSAEREKILHTHYAWYRRGGRTESLESFLRSVFTIEPINNPLTAHFVMMNPTRGTRAVTYNNAFAAADPLRSTSFHQRVFR